MHRRDLMQGIAPMGDGGSEMQTGEGEVTQKAFQQEAFNILSWSINRKWQCYLSRGLGSLGHLQPVLEMPSKSREQGRISSAFTFLSPPVGL